MIEEQVFKLISHLADGRVYESIAPQGTSPPYITYTLISERINDVLNGYSYTDVRIQFDTYAKTATIAKTLILEVKQALDPLNPTQITITRSYEHDTQLRRCSMEILLTI